MGVIVGLHGMEGVGAMHNILALQRSQHGLHTSGSNVCSLHEVQQLASITEQLHCCVLQAGVWSLLARWRAEGSAHRSPAAGELCRTPSEVLLVNAYIAKLHALACTWRCCTLPVLPHPLTSRAAVSDVTVMSDSQALAHSGNSLVDLRTSDVPDSKHVCWCGSLCRLVVICSNTPVYFAGWR